MKTVLITDSTDLFGSEAAHFFPASGHTVVGIDNDMCHVFFDVEASTSWNRDRFADQLGDRYIHRNLDIRDADAIQRLSAESNAYIVLVIHTAAQPSMTDGLSFRVEDLIYE